ncbi:hypothetical protein AX16_009776 [Volvariella volvacea WC 439]|nr:hypothetical protein AX16_009776 [Volvariella volvacea WC 439]
MLISRVHPLSLSIPPRLHTTYSKNGRPFTRAELAYPWSMSSWAGRSICKCTSRNLEIILYQSQFSFSSGFMPYGDFWRKHRKLFHQEFHPAAIVRYQPHEIKATKDMLVRLLDDPDDFLEHFRHMAGALVMAVAYGLDVLPKDDPYIAAAKGAVHPATVAMVPGTFLVDSLPILKRVPDWMPGAGFKRKAKEWRKLAETMWEMPYTAGKKRIAEGNAPASYISYCLEKVDDSKDVAEQELLIQDTAAAMYIAGSDTPVSALGTFFLAMLANPEAQRKAQEELDRVLGKGNLPEFSDEENLPYVSAIVKEVLRWHPVTPIAVPHCLTEEDVYRGYRIPANSVMIPNVWAMMHDETVYPDPYNFKPERFLKNGKIDPSVKDPAGMAFGFGRRICPGRFMATASLWISIAMILSTLEIKKARDENGKEIEPNYEYVSSMVCIPENFKCSIKARSKEIETMLRSEKYTSEF